MKRVSRSYGEARVPATGPLPAGAGTRGAGRIHAARRPPLERTFIDLNAFSG
jgi:hypothetical protein